MFLLMLLSGRLVYHSDSLIRELGGTAGCDSACNVCETPCYNVDIDVEIESCKQVSFDYLSKAVSLLRSFVCWLLRIAGLM